MGVGPQLPPDAVEVSGLSTIIEENAAPPYLELTLRANGRSYRVAILVAEEEWALTVRDERGKMLTGEPELYPSQGDAILAAMLAALQNSNPWLH